MRHEHANTCRRVGPFLVCKERLHIHLRTYYADRWHHLFADAVLIFVLGAVIAVVASVVQKTRSLPEPVEWSATRRDVFSDVGSARLELRYFTPEGEQVGRGPVRPTVDKKTLVWFLVHTDANAPSIFEIALSSRVRWTGKQSVASGDAASGDEQHITWRPCIEAPCGAGDGAFEIEITPQHDDRGRPIAAVSGGRWLVTHPDRGIIETKFPVIETPPTHD